MNDIHPHWHSTEGERNPPPPPLTPTTDVRPEKTLNRLRKGIHVRVAASGITRRPAAVFGILLVLTAGFIAFEGASELQGETVSMETAASAPSADNDEAPSTTVEIRITAKGLSPQTAQVHPGQTIVWINEQEVPHILESETIKGEDGETLYTPAIFPGSEYRFPLASDQPAGRHSYLSITSMEISGELNVIAGTAAATPNTPLVNIPGAAQTSTDNAEPKVLLAKTDGDTTTDAEDDFPTSQENLIPVNPYTIEGGRRHPFDTEGRPIEELFDAPTSLRGSAPNVYAPSRTTSLPRPMRQPETGPGLWIVSALSLAALFALTRRCIARIR